MIRVIVILIVVGFVATSFAVMSNLGANNSSLGRWVDNIVKPISSKSNIGSLPGGRHSDGIAFVSSDKFNSTFLESDLPAGTRWYANLTCCNPCGPFYNTFRSGPITGSHFTFSCLNIISKFSYNITTSNRTYKPSPPSGSFTYAHNPYVFEAVSFLKVSYPVTFSETGLPTGYSWNLAFNGVELALSNRSYTFNATNNTYVYSASSKNYGNLSGSVIVNGSSQSINLSFVLQTYFVTFSESCLPNGTIWYLNLSDGQTLSSTACNISFYEPNGTYIYSITTSNHICRYSANLGFFTVKGRSVSESVRFSRIMYSITIIESGLPSGSTWYVDITGNNGTVYDSGAISGSSYSFPLTNGTYSYTVGNISGLICSLYYLYSYKRDNILGNRYKGESRGGFLKLLHTPGNTVI